MLTGMGDLIPFRDRGKRRASRWTRADAYRRSTAEPTVLPRGRRGARWFPIVLVALPLAAGSAVFLAPKLGDGIAADAAVPVRQVVDRESAHFPICGSGKRITCVVDGDTIWYRGLKIRLADIDTPEVSNPGCTNEARMGHRATRKLQALLNQGNFTVAPNPDGRESDKYGRALRVLTRNGQSLGSELVDAGLATRWGGPRVEWC
jgi:endonuclease YncB( thermonuclease family)